MKFLFGALAVTYAVTPTQKVVQLLNDMHAKGKKEKHEEEVQFATYNQWCGDEQSRTKRQIQEAAESIELLNAGIYSHKTESQKLQREIESDDMDIAKFQADIKAATTVRGVEREDFMNTNTDYSESIDALGRAIMVLKNQRHDTPASDQEAAFLEVKNLMPPRAKKIVDAFLAEDGEDDADHLAVSAPEANAYEFQSQKIIDMLVKLKDKFKDERTKIQKEEADAKHAFNMLVQDLNSSISDSTNLRDERKVRRADHLKNKGLKTGELKDTTASKADDESYLQETTATCNLKSKDFEARQELRADELVALERAIEVLSSDAIAGNAAKHLPKLAQTGTSFIALRKVTNNIEPSKDDQDMRSLRVADYLREAAGRLHSPVLSNLAMKAQDDPFIKIRQMIQDLIHRLLEEANEEAEHKGWCDKELKANELTRKEKSTRVDQLKAKSEELNANIAQLGEQISELSQAVADLSAAMSEATKLREKEKEENELTIKDAKEAQTAVARATAILKDFYDRAATATSLVQGKQTPEPAIFDSPYKGMQSENGGVTGMLEVIQSDFARLETETTSAENQAQAEHDKYMQTSTVDKAQKNKDIEHKTSKKNNQESELTNTLADLDGTEKELDTAMNYYDKLKPTCIDTGVSYEERVARRKEEIQSLKEALNILNGEEVSNNIG